jgi:hypothetical protein
MNLLGLVGAALFLLGSLSWTTASPLSAVTPATEDLQAANQLNSTYPSVDEYQVKLFLLSSTTTAVPKSRKQQKQQQQQAQNQQEIVFKKWKKLHQSKANNVLQSVVSSVIQNQTECKYSHKIKIGKKSVRLARNYK